MLHGIIPNSVASDSRQIRTYSNTLAIMHAVGGEGSNLAGEATRKLLAIAIAIAIAIAYGAPSIWKTAIVASLFNFGQVLLNSTLAASKVL